MAYYTGPTGSTVQSSNKKPTATTGLNLTQKGYPASYGVVRGTTSDSGLLNDRGYPTTTQYGSSSGGGSGTKTSTGGSGSGGSRAGGSGSGGGVSDSAAAYNALLAAYRQNDYADYLAQMRAAAQKAYDNSMNSLNNAYNEQMNSLNSNLQSTRDQMLKNYNYSRGNIANDAESSLRQAYINNMLSRRNLGQQMTAQGLSGGATETTLAGMLNNYGNARNDINNTANKSYADLENNYNSNLAQAQQAFNSAVANANLQKAQQQMSLENNLANNQMSALSDYHQLMQRENQNYLDLLKAAIANGASFSWNPTEANNEVKAVALQQAANPTLATNYQAIQDLLSAQSAPGTTTPGITVVNPATSGNYLEQILSQLRR